MSRQWVTTRFGDRVDAAQALSVRHRLFDGRPLGVDDRHMLELQWERDDDVLAVFLDRVDCERALHAFIRQGWVPVMADPHLLQGLAVNPTRIRTCSTASNDAGHSWRTQAEVAPDGFPYWTADGLSRAEALKLVGELCEQLEAEKATWVDPDFTRPAWRGVTAAEDGLAD